MIQSCVIWCLLSISVLTRQTQMTKEKQGLWPGQICLTRSGTSPGSGLICLTKYEMSKILNLKDLDFFQPCPPPVSKSEFERHTGICQYPAIWQQSICVVTSYHIVSYHIMSYHIISYYKYCNACSWSTWCMILALGRYNIRYYVQYARIYSAIFTIILVIICSLLNFKGWQNKLVSVLNYIIYPIGHGIAW